MEPYYVTAFSIVISIYLCLIRCKQTSNLKASSNTLNTWDNITSVDECFNNMSKLYMP